MFFHGVFWLLLIPSFLRSVFKIHVYCPYSLFTTLLLVSRWQQNFPFVLSSLRQHLSREKGFFQFLFIRRITKAWNKGSVYFKVITLLGANTKRKPQKSERKKLSDFPSDQNSYSPKIVYNILEHFKGPHF